MPLIAVGVAAAALTFGGAAAIGGVIAGTATLATVFEATAAVGATIGAVGAVTGNKTLQTAGLVIGGIGGVGALASSAGLLGADATTASIFGSSSSDAAAGDAAMNAGFVGDDAASTGASAADVVTSVTQNLPAGLTDDAGNTIVPDDFSPTSFSDSTMAMENAPTDAMEAPASTGAQTPTTTAPPTTPTAAGAPPGTTGTPTAAAAAATPPATTVPGVGGTPSAVTGTPSSISTADASWLSQQYPNPAAGMTATNNATGNSFTYTMGQGWTQNAPSTGIMNFLKSSGGGMVGMGVVQAAGSFLQGSLSTLTPAQVAAYNAQAAQNQAAANLTSKQVANVSGALPTASGGGQVMVSPAGAPKAPVAPQVTGFINTPMGAT